MLVIPELHHLEKLIRRHDGAMRVSVPVIVGPGSGYPVYQLELGSEDPCAPAVGFFGGVHGNERIGSKVVLAFLHTLLERLRWDEGLHHLLGRVRILFMPIINPSGMALNRRGTSAGIDLMRNAPVDSRSAHWLLGGQRLSRHLPWYRGRKGELAPENRAVIKAVQARLLCAPFSLALDCHSGFGHQDSIWFPYAHSREPIPHLPELFALRSLFRRTYPDHVLYRIEPQCRHYMTHGDLWDHLYRLSLARADHCFLPLTLEMGSWLWVRKNPRQLFAPAGLFNPLVPHRLRRILRQHLLWCDFLVRAVASYPRWTPNVCDRTDLKRRAQDHWGRHYQPYAATASSTGHNAA